MCHNDRTMRDTQATPEAYASLQGLMAMLALPPVRCDDGTFRKRRVEIEIADGIWACIDSMIIEAERLLFTFGANGTRVEYVFARSEGVPEWRVERIEAVAFMELR